MKLSEQQAQALVIIAQDSVRINVSGVFTFKIETRRDLLRDILSQQNIVPTELDPSKAGD